MVYAASDDSSWHSGGDQLAAGQWTVVLIKFIIVFLIVQPGSRAVVVPQGEKYDTPSCEKRCW